MEWGLAIGILIVGAIFAFIGYVILVETRTHRFWQRKVEEGDLEMISQLVTAEVERWRNERPPKGMPASVWQGIQGIELIEVGRDYIHVASVAEPQFALVGGARRQVSGALDEAKRITARLAERLFYDIPHVRPDRVQIDIYSTFHEADGTVTQRCIMSTLARRATAAQIDWDNDPPEAVADQLGAQYQRDAHGEPVPMEPDDEAVRAGDNGARPHPPELGPER